MSSVSTFHWFQYHAITQALKEAEIRHLVGWFSDLTGAARFKLYVESSSLEVATELCMQVESHYLSNSTQPLKSAYLA